MSKKIECKNCGVPLQGKEYQLKVVSYPYNPEWPLTYEDAGVFGSPECLQRYLAKDTAELLLQEVIAECASHLADGQLQIARPSAPLISRIQAYLDSGKYGIEAGS